jgi:hypothetical protein
MNPLTPNSERPPNRTSCSFEAVTGNHSSSARNGANHARVTILGQGAWLIWTKPPEPIAPDPRTS